jgi:hypothetical protein
MCRKSVRRPSFVSQSGHDLCPNETQVLAANRQIVLQSQRIEELESYLGCIVTLSAKVRELELDTSL